MSCFTTSMFSGRAHTLLLWFAALLFCVSAAPPALAKSKEACSMYATDRQRQFFKQHVACLDMPPYTSNTFSSRVRLSHPSSVTTTLSSIRTPPPMSG